MFIGHFAVGFATKRLAPETSLGWHLLAPAFLDVLFPIFVVAGLESVAIVPGYTVVQPLDLHDIPWSHSLVMSLVWSALFAAVFFALKKNARTAGILAFGVFSHFILDWVTHRPEMQLFPGSPHTLGLHLWSSVPGTLVTELTMFGLALFLYVKGSRPTSPGGTRGLVAWVATMLLFYFGNVFGPPPPSVNLVLSGIFALVLVLPWAAAFDKRRSFAP